MKNYILVVLFLFLCRIGGMAQVDKGLETITENSVRSQISFLADDLLEGRAAGSWGGKIAAAYIVSLLDDMGVSAWKDSYYQPFEAIKSEKTNRYSVNPAKRDSLLQSGGVPVEMRNIIACIPGRLSDEYVIVGAHYDHLGIDKAVNGDSLYNGADDNASGVSAVLQIAKAFLATGQQPERTVLFAFWDGEERGLLGSAYFVSVFLDPTKIKGYLNFDMIGRNTDEAVQTHVVYFYTESHPVFETWMKSHIQRYDLKLTPEYRPWDKPVGGSDNASFARKEIPIIWYHTNGHPDYHKPSDHADKINYPKAVDIIKSAYLNLWNMANERDF